MPETLALETEKPRRKVVYKRPNPVYRKSTLRKMSPTAREVAALIGEAQSVINRLKSMLPGIAEMEKQHMERAEQVEKVVNRLKGD